MFLIGYDPATGRVVFITRDAGQPRAEGLNHMVVSEHPEINDVTDLYVGTDPRCGNRTLVAKPRPKVVDPNRLVI